jgi:mevalonate kinase
MITATAPGKVILFGEHAVVYGRPALAAPVTQLRARAVVEMGDGPEVRLVAPDLGRATTLAAARADNALAATARLMEQRAGRPLPPGLSLSVSSAIPIASGLGSGAAIAVAVIRALGDCFQLALSREEVSALAYEIERLHHGTPSGIDNTVIAFEQPVYFVRQQPANRIETFRPARPLRLVIADTGVRSATKVVVGDVRRRWEAERDRFEAIFDACGRLAEAGRAALAAGDLAAVGRLMDENHAQLVEMTVSSADLDHLAGAARAAGALGAKLSGAGRGGNLIALVDESGEAAVCDGLMAAGAARLFRSDVG